MAIKKIQHRENAVSPIIAEILMTALVILFIAIIIAILLGMIPQFPYEEKEIPEIIKIVDIIGDANDGIVKLKNVGDADIINSEYSAAVYVDEIKKRVVIITLKADKFIPTNHFGISKLYGAGPVGETWDKGASGFFDLKNGIIYKGCFLRIDIIRNSDNEIISTSKYSVT